MRRREFTLTGLGVLAGLSGCLEPILVDGSVDILLVNGTSDPHQVHIIVENEGEMVLNEKYRVPADESKWIRDAFGEQSYHISVIVPGEGRRNLDYTMSGCDGGQITVTISATSSLIVSQDECGETTKDK